MAFNYAGSRDTADRLLTNFGQVVSLRRTTASGTAWEPTQATADYATVGAKIEFTLKQLQSGNVLDTDERWLIAAGPLTTLGITSIAPPDSLVVGGVLHPVLLAKPLNLGGTTVMYDCHIRY